MVCSSGIGFDPLIDGTRHTFGFEGIWQGTAVLYDHQTRSIWMHLTGTCIEGKHEGVVLERLDTGRHTTWRDWLTLHPDTDVIARDPRWMNRAGDTGYFAREGARSGSAFLPPTFGQTIHDRDDRLEPHALVYGVVVGKTARAYPFHRLESAGLAEEVVAGVPVTVWYDRRARSAAAFDRRIGDVTLTFALDSKGVIRDAATKSRWTLDGVCVEGARLGVRLKPLRGLMAEWYGWFANHPQTTLWRQF